MGKRLKQAVLVFIAACAAAQLVRPDRANPATDASHSIQAHTGTTRGLVAVLDRSCRDCHTNQAVESIGTRTPSKNVSHISSRPFAKRSGLRDMPGLSVSIRSAARPRCRLSGVPVRTRVSTRSRQVPVAGPHLLPVHDDDVAVDRGPRPQRGEVAPGVRLGEALTPELLTRQERGQERLGERRCELEHRRRHDLDRLVGVRQLQPGAG